MLAPKEASRSSHRQATAQQALLSTGQMARPEWHLARAHLEAARLRPVAGDLGRPDHLDRAGRRADRFVLKAAMQALRPAPVLQAVSPEVPEPTEVWLATARVRPAEAWVPTWPQVPVQTEALPEQAVRPSAVAAEQPVALAAESVLTSAVAQVQALQPVAAAVPDAQPGAARQQAAEAAVQPSEPVAAEEVAAVVQPDVAAAGVLLRAVAAVQDVQPEAAVVVVAAQPWAPEVAAALPRVAEAVQAARPEEQQAAPAGQARPSVAAWAAVPEDPCCRQVALARR